MPLYDCLVVGGGPAGMSAALGLCRALRSCVIFDDGQYRNWATSYMHTVPTWDHRRPEEFREKALAELLSGKYATVCEIATSPVLSVSKRVVPYVDPRRPGGGESRREIFVALDQNGIEWFGRTVIFASGVQDLIPSSVSLPGFAEGWGQSIFHCLFCHGFEERNSPSAGVLTLVPEAFQFSVAFAGMSSKLAKKITIYTNGWSVEDAIAAGQADDEEKKGPAADLKAITKLILDNGFEIDERPIARLVPYKTNVDRSAEDQLPKIDIHFKDGSVVTHTFLVCRPNQQVRNREIMESLGVRFHAQTGLVEVFSAMNSTHVPGVFVAGDNNTMFQQIVNAFCQGGMTAGGVHHYLLTKELNGDP